MPSPLRSGGLYGTAWIESDAARGVRALLLGLALICATAAAAGAADAPAAGTARPPGMASLPKVTSPRLYVIDCGTLAYNRPEDYQLTREEVADTNMSVPCYLVIHAQGILL